jgi:hypothetical protein
MFYEVFTVTMIYLFRPDLSRTATARGHAIPVSQHPTDLWLDFLNVCWPLLPAKPGAWVLSMYLNA